jgi:hypothetical protein
MHKTFYSQSLKETGDLKDPDTDGSTLWTCGLIHSAGQDPVAEIKNRVIISLLSKQLWNPSSIMEGG